MTPKIADNCQGHARGRCKVYWRNGPEELWQGGHAPVKLSRIRNAMAINQARGVWKYAEYRIERVELTQEQKERLQELKRKKEGLFVLNPEEEEINGKH